MSHCWNFNTKELTDKICKINASDEVLSILQCSCKDLIDLCGGITTDDIDTISLRITVNPSGIIQATTQTSLYTVTRLFDFETREIDNQYMQVYYPQKGIGTYLLYNQIQAAKQLGFVKMNVVATAPDSDTFFSGHYCWARLGFQLISHEQNEFADWLKKHGRNEKNFDELLKTTEGKNLWLKNGYTWLGEFSLEDESTALNTFYRYIQEKGYGS